MKVYVVLECYAYEGGIVVAVFSTDDAATAYVKTHDPLWHKPHPRNHWFDVEEWEVDASTV